jgi:hypothetical protein
MLGTWMGRKEGAMAAVELDFDILELIGGVLSWFMEALRSLSGLRYREGGGGDVVLEEPREENPHEPDVATEIVIPARLVVGIRIESEWGLTLELEEAARPDPVMRFRLAAPGSGTYVLASCDERLPMAQKDFIGFLKQVQAG